jgi:hypothetical protein
VYGTTVPQTGSFLAAPLIAARIGLAGIGGPTIAQACATSGHKLFKDLFFS